MSILYITGFISCNLWIHSKLCYHNLIRLACFLCIIHTFRGRGVTDYSKQSTWNLLHSYIDEHSKKLIDEYSGDVAEAITIFQSQCSNMNFSDKIRYNRQFQQVVHKIGDSEINNIKRFHNAEDLEVSVGNSYYEYQVMHICLKKIQSRREISSSDNHLSRRVKKIWKKCWSKILIVICLANWLIGFRSFNKIRRKSKFWLIKIHSLWRLSSNWKQLSSKEKEE